MIDEEMSALHRAVLSKRTQRQAAELSLDSDMNRVIEPRQFKSIRRKVGRCLYSISDKVKEVIGMDRQFYKERLLDKLKVKQDSKEQQELILYDNPEKTKRYILKSFIRFYLRTLMNCNQTVQESYLNLIRERYEKLDSIQKVTFRDIQMSIDEMERAMEVDAEDKNKIVDLLTSAFSFGSLSIGMLD